MPISRILVLAATALLASSPLIAQDQPKRDDPRAREALQLFYSFCMNEAGDQTRALAVLGDGNAMAKRLTPETMNAIQGQVGGVGWAIRSPSNAQLLLDYNPTGFCEVRIAEADEASVVMQFHLTKNLIAVDSRGKLTAPEKRSENGATLTFQTFAYDLHGRKALIALTTSDKRVGEQQHLITFGFVS